MISPEVIARNGAKPRFAIERAAEIGDKDWELVLRRNLSWGLSISVQKYLNLRPLSSIYEESGRKYFPEGSEERKVLDRYRVSKYLEFNHSARRTLQERFGTEAILRLSMDAFQEDYGKNGEFPGIFERLAEQFHFVTQSLPKSNADLIAEKFDTGIGDTLGRRIPQPVKKFAIAAFAVGIIYSAKMPGRFS